MAELTFKLGYWGGFSDGRGCSQANLLLLVEKETRI
jgi:hypothetical protein